MLGGLIITQQVIGLTSFCTSFGPYNAIGMPSFGLFHDSYLVEQGIISI